MEISLYQVELLLSKAYQVGWDESGEGYNSEYCRASYCRLQEIKADHIKEILKELGSSKSGTDHIELKNGVVK